jgi:hypothetical protein
MLKSDTVIPTDFLDKQLILHFLDTEVLQAGYRISHKFLVAVTGNNYPNHFSLFRKET